MRRLTASRAALAFKCSFFLRDEVQHEDWFPSDAAAEGTALHTLIEADINDLPPPDVFAGMSEESANRVQRKYTTWRAWAKTERRVGWRPEVALAYHARSDSARELEPKFHRDYSGAGEGDVCMQLDLAYMGEDADGPYLCVDDWKSGADSAYATAQLGLGALAFSRVVGVERARVRAVYVGEESVEVKEAWLQSFDLDMVRSHVLRVVDLPDPEPVPGPHCAGLWCPARHACPATVRAMAEVAQLPVQEIARLVSSAIRTPEDAGNAHVRLRVIKDAVKAIDERIRAVVEEQGPAPTPTGKVLRLVTTTRETFARSRLPKEHAERILGELREVGALTESTSTYLRESAK